jgi:hypothetical protein
MIAARREFCTLFDSNYLFKALALYESLERRCGGAGFHLTAFCFDEAAQELLGRLALPHLSTVALRELETYDDELAATKADRTPLEYCCTATPALPLYMLDKRPELDEITYLDADLYFFGNPQSIFEELGGDSILMIEHRFPPHLRHHAVNGRFNVQFLTFRRDAAGLACLHWWHDRCIEWCYFRLEETRFADQKYLDQWPDLFEGVHILRHKGGGLAPWNVSGYDIREEGGKVFVDEDPLVFFHFHKVRLRVDGRYDWRAPGYVVPMQARELVYKPYLRALDEAKERVWAIDPSFGAGLSAVPGVAVRLQEARANLGARVTHAAPGLARLRHRAVQKASER